MDPSQDNFGSFAAGGTASQFSGVSAGAVSGGATSSGGAMPGNVPVMSSGTGDVILNTGGDGSGGKSRRGLVILLVVLVLLVVGVGVGFAVWGGGDNKSVNGNTETVTEGVQRYVDFIVNGNVGDSAGYTYQKNRIYYVAEEFYNADTEGFDEFYDTARALLENAIQENENSGIRDSLDEQLEILNLLNVARSVFKYSVNGLMGSYIQGNYSSIEEEIYSGLGSLQQDANGYIETYVNMVNEYVDAVEKMMNLYYESGCIADTIDDMDSCEMPAEYAIKYNESRNAAENAFMEAEYVIESVIPYYIQNALNLVSENEGISTDE